MMVLIDADQADCLPSVRETRNLQVAMLQPVTIFISDIWLLP